MNQRERVMATIKHKEPDRVPVDLGSTPSSGISAIAYVNLTKHLGMQNNSVRVYDVCQQLAQPEDEILKMFKIDTIDIGRSFNTHDENWYSYKLPNGMSIEYPSWFHPAEESDGSLIATGNGEEILARMPKGAAFFDQTVFPYIDGYPSNLDYLANDMSRVSWQAFAHSPWDHAEDEGFWETLRKRCIQLKESTDYALMIVAGCNLFEWGTFLRRIDNFLMDLMLDHKNVERLLDALMELHLQTLERVCGAVGDVADILRFGDDLGTDSGPFMQPSLYRKLIKPRQRLLCGYVKEYSTMNTFLHSCGDIYELIPDLIEAGYDIINPVQTNARGMVPEKLKKEFGKDITFWGGGIDTRHLLNHGSPGEVKYHVKKNLDIFAPGGGYVFNTIHNILPDVPAENICAMFEAVEEFNSS